MGGGLNLSANIKHLLFLLLFVGTPYLGYSQTTVKGAVTDSLENPVPFALIKLSTPSDSNSVYRYTDGKGKYQVESIENGKVNLKVSKLGFRSETVPLDLEGETKVVNITLKEKATKLDEVIIRTERPFRVKEDTITVKTKFYVDGTEETVEEMLKKIPGLNIDSKGTIKIGNKEIEKLKVEGDDFFGKGYKILSKNMPAYPIEEVEILKNYSNNGLLKGIEESDKVALNLKLDDKSKRVWFGNAEASLGNDNFYQLKANLMNFGKKNKYYFLTNFNNVGHDATGEIKNLTHPTHHNEPGSIGDDAQLGSLLQMSATNLNFDKNRTTFNNEKLISLNAIFNPTDNLKIKPLAFFDWDKTDFFRDKVDVVETNAAHFTNTENYELHNKKRIAFGKMDITYDISDTQELKSITKYNDGYFKDVSHLVFNGNSTTENLKHPKTEFDQKIKYTNKFKDKKAFLLTARFIDEKSPQNFQVNRFFFEGLFPEHSNADAVKQKVTSSMQYMGVNAHLLDRKESGNLFELQVGDDYRRDKLSSVFSLLKEDEIAHRPNNYQNATRYHVNNLYLKAKYRYEFSDFGITGQVNLHQFYNKLENESETEDQSPFFINPSISIDWDINNYNKIKVTYSKNRTNAEILDIYNGYVLTGYRNFAKGVGNLTQLDASSFNINYELGNWGDRFFANTYFSYTKNHDFFSTNSVVRQDYTKSEKILIKDRSFLSLHTNINYYIKPISSNLKLKFGYSKSNYKNKVNSSALREVVSHNYNYGLTLRSGFLGPFNFHIGTKWRNNKIKTTSENSYRTNTSFANFVFSINEAFNVQLDSERYYFGNLDGKNTYYFMDVEANYKLIKNKLSLSLTGKNLFNTKTFKNFSISDIGTTTTQYRLLPRMVLVSLKYRF